MSLLFFGIVGGRPLAAEDWGPIIGGIVVSGL